MAYINDLHTLTQLKKLYLDNNGEIISEGTMGEYGSNGDTPVEIDSARKFTERLLPYV
jgi:hypothetical protein